MKIRRYVAKNTQEAILKVKMDLGSEALILNTRKIRKKGLLGLFSKPLTEVLAAVDEYGQKLASADKTGSSQSSMSNFVDDSDKKEEKIAILENRISGIEETLRELCEKVLNGSRPTVGTEAVEDSKKLKAGFAEVFYNNLVSNEVDPEIARKVVNAAASRLPASAGVSEMAAQLSGIIAGLLGKPETIKENSEGKPVTVIFVGPTGVGKTTTLAKIAANYLLNRKKSVGLITADTYRIAAVEQLKTYAEILGIPVSVVYTPAEMQEAISQYSDKDLILIDTAGRSHKNKAQFEELKALVAASGADEIYLVLSTTTSWKNCREILKSYSFLRDYKLLFTKTDETPVLGIVLNVRYMTGKSLSYITTGQSVPDDIETVNVDKITKNLIGSYLKDGPS
ncbi:MAG TPA: flagellar biosynthesis protein FlhF [Clostridiales bacterium]|nr:flagellar biosynthesis protein FlhF [Clostridiales bacterium]HPV01536.1 flagellar biosynthesis protein FlhF [Clostridiales bacterium]